MILPKTKRVGLLFPGAVPVIIFFAAQGCTPFERAATGDGSAIHNRGQDEFKSGDLAAAKADFQEAIRLDPKIAGRYVDLAVVEEAMGDLERAQTNCQTSERLDPTQGSAFVNLSFIDCELGLYAEALKQAKTAVALKPNDAHAWGNLAFAEVGVKDYPAAIAAADKGLSLAPGTSSVEMTKAKALFMMGKRQDAIRLWKAVAAHGSRDSDRASAYVKNPDSVKSQPN
jgi:tetratricopeptide (TPR) repeat protein